MHPRRGRLDQVEPVRHALGRDQQRPGRERVGDRLDRAAQFNRARAGRAASGDPDRSRERAAGRGGDGHRERGGQRAVGQLAQQTGGGRHRGGLRGPGRAGLRLGAEGGGAGGRGRARQSLARRPRGGGSLTGRVGIGRRRAARGRQQRRGGRGRAAEVRDRGHGRAELLGGGGQLAVGRPRAAQRLGDQQAGDADLGRDCAPELGVIGLPLLGPCQHLGRPGLVGEQIGQGGREVAFGLGVEQISGHGAHRSFRPPGQSGWGTSSR